MLLRKACQGSEFAGAGIGDQDIDLSLRRHRFVKAIEVLQFGDVPPNADDVAADRFYGLVELLLATACYEDKGTFVDEALCNGETYPRATAGNHSRFSVQLAHNHHFSIC